MHSWEALQTALPLIEEKLGYTFVNKNLLLLAFVHRSYVNENKDKADKHNERLEFLGDSVLGLIVADHLYIDLPFQPEGHLSFIRSRLVEASSCVAYMQKLGACDYVLLGKGEKMNGGKGRDSILADLFEALIGAIYLDGGFEIAKHFFLNQFSQEIAQALEAPSTNWKAELQDYAQKKYQKPPEYKILKEEGPDHNKTFHIAVLVASKEIGLGVGPSKKQAEQAAAAHALHSLQAY